MKLNTFTRMTKKKSDTKKYRREGNIPAVLYSKGKASEAIAVNEADFLTLLREIKKGHLSTTKITLADENGKERKAIVKDIQYHLTTYRVIHLDFEELIDDVLVKVNIPIEFTGVIECVGIKLGGVLRQVIRKLRVQCLPKHMPDLFEMDVRNLSISDKKRLKELDIPSNVKPLDKLDEVCVVIAKR
jgi:large subunit ribosomal protein L25